MTALLKAILPGALLTFIVSMIIGSNGSRGDFLAIHQTAISTYDFYWSWPLFIAATGLAWAIFLMMK